MARYMNYLRDQRAPVRSSTVLPGSYPQVQTDNDWETISVYSSNDRINPSVPPTPIPRTSFQAPVNGMRYPSQWNEARVEHPMQTFGSM
jgi:hypothetical protein